MRLTDVRAQFTCFGRLPIVGRDQDYGLQTMDFVFTDTFYSVYESISDEEAALIDDGIRRLLQDHATGWARRGRIEGDSGSAWILTLTSRGIETSLYWEYYDDETIVLLALVLTHV